MQPAPPSFPTRRAILASLAAAAGAGAYFSKPGLYAEVLAAGLVRTPTQAEGPFYPDKLPLDTDNDLLIINDKVTPAVGDVTHLTGQVLDANGEPLRNAVVEIWQVDGRGVYLHSRSSNGDRRDANFQGFGRFLTDAKGRYYFRTVKPVPYPGRTPHIHVKVNKGREELLTTQLYIKGHPQNARDGLLNRIRNKAQRDSVLVDFTPIKDAHAGQFAANFNMVVGWTPKA